MNTYSELRQKQQKEVDDFPFFFAFSNKQFEEGMAEFGLEPNDTNKIYRLSDTGDYYLRSDTDRLCEMFERHIKEVQTQIDADTTGEGFIFEMFNYELANHEYVITYDITDTLNALGLELGDVQNDQRLKHGLELARQNQLCQRRE
jgi:hypothetical protein